jgi:hypothetical protein
MGRITHTVVNRAQICRNCALSENHKKLISMLKLVGFSLNIFETEVDAVRACPELTDAGEAQTGITP